MRAKSESLSIALSVIPAQGGELYHALAYFVQQLLRVHVCVIKADLLKNIHLRCRRRCVSLLIHILETLFGDIRLPFPRRARGQE